MVLTATPAAPPTPFERFRRAANRPVVAVIAVGLLAAGLRFAHLGYPQKRVFDEYYYSKSACIFLGYSNERCDINSSDERYWRRERGDTGAWVHPPLGKWAVALGELAFGTGSFGWRVSSAVFGTASVILLAVIAQLLFGSPIWTFTTGLLLATEHLNFVQSRVAMLDIFVTTWIVAGFLFLLLDRRWIERRTSAAGTGPPELSSRLAADGPEAAPTPSATTGGSGSSSGPAPAAQAESSEGPPTALPEPLWRPWRVVAGIALGAAVATKWSGLTGLATAVVLAVIWEVTRRRAAGLARPVWDAVRSEGFGIVISLLLVPAAVYVASYAVWFGQHEWAFAEWLRLQGAIVDYHAGLKVVDESGKPIHPYLTQAWKILVWRPVLYYADYAIEGVRKVIYANGNAAIFWGSLLAVPFTAVRWWRHRDWRAGFIVVIVLGLYVPWLFVSRPQFLFYATPLTPFLVLACVYALRDLSEMHVAGSRSRPYLPFVVGFVVLSVGLFVWFWPALTGGPLSNEAFRLRAWFPTWT